MGYAWLYKLFQKLKVTSLNTPLPSNRKFGLFFSGVFAAFAIYAYLKHQNHQALLAGLLAIAFCALALAVPAVLAPLNRAWYRLGLLLGRVVNPIVLGIIFFFLLTPISFFTRMSGRDVLRLKKRESGSYWIDRTPVGPDADSFKNQF